MDRRLRAAATARNRSPLLEVLRRFLPSTGTVLEVASGTGEHAVFFAKELAPLVWQPSEIDPDGLASIRAWRDSDGTENLRAPIPVDVESEAWPIDRDEPIDAIVNVNMIHISPWTACEGLFRGAARHLPAEAPMILYGPFQREGRHTAPSNEAFDASLRARNPDWGVRDLGDVAVVANRSGFMLEETISMPANNFSVVFRKRATSP